MASLRLQIKPPSGCEVAPGPDFVAAPRAEHRDPEAAIETPFVAEYRLRQCIGQMAASQVIEDEALLGGVRPPSGGYHAYNAILRNHFGKPRTQMTLAELEAAVGCLERNRLSDYFHLLDDDQRYWFSASRRGHIVPRTARRR